MPRRPILLGLLLAAVTTLAVVVLVRPPAGDQRAAIDQPAPAIAGTTLDGASFDLAAHRGHPVIVNFWGPSCVPCRDEFPLLAAKLAEHAADGLVVVGVLTDDPPEPARAFVDEYGATWPTVDRPGQGDQDRLPRGRPAADLLHRRSRGHPLDPDRRADRRRLRAPVRADRAVSAGSASGGGADDDGAAGEAAVVVRGLVKRYGDADRRRRRLAGGRARRARRAARAERRRQDDDRRDRRGLPARRTAGRVRVLGQDPATGGRRLRARVGLMLQGGGIDPRAQPRETLVQYGRFHADPRDPDELLDLVGLRAVARTRYRRLSGGERQRLGLALALVGRPEVVILDEPTAGMDPEARAATRAIVADLRGGGRRDPADEPRPRRRRAAGRPDRACSTPGRIVAAGHAGRAGARASGRGCGSASIARSAPTSSASSSVACPLRGPGAALVAEADAGRYRVEGVEPDAALIAALAELVRRRRTA